MKSLILKHAAFGISLMQFIHMLFYETLIKRFQLVRITATDNCYYKIGPIIEMIDCHGARFVYI